MIIYSCQGADFSRGEGGPGSGPGRASGPRSDPPSPGRVTEHPRPAMGGYVPRHAAQAPTPLDPPAGHPCARRQRLDRRARVPRTAVAARGRPNRYCGRDGLCPVRRRTGPTRVRDSGPHGVALGADPGRRPGNRRPSSDCGLRGSRGPGAGRTARSRDGSDGALARVLGAAEGEQSGRQGATAAPTGRFRRRRIRLTQRQEWRRNRDDDRACAGRAGYFRRFRDRSFPRRGRMTRHRRHRPGLGKEGWARRQRRHLHSPQACYKHYQEGAANAYIRARLGGAA
jgi:hypothetical protein